MKYKPKCPECKKTDKIEVGVYSDKKTGEVLAKYFECVRCYCVIDKIFDESEY